MSPPMIQRDRRRDDRLPSRLPVKVKCERADHRSLAGQTRNLSAGGAMLEIISPTRIPAGEHVRLGIATHPRHHGLLRADNFLDATVLRSLGHGDRQHVAVRFAQRQSTPLARAG